MSAKHEVELHVLKLLYFLMWFSRLIFANIWSKVGTFANSVLCNFECLDITMLYNLVIIWIGIPILQLNKTKLCPKTVTSQYISIYRVCMNECPSHTVNIMYRQIHKYHTKSPRAFIYIKTKKKDFFIFLSLFGIFYI